MNVFQLCVFEMYVVYLFIWKGEHIDIDISIHSFDILQFHQSAHYTFKRLIYKIMYGNLIKLLYWGRVKMWTEHDKRFITSDFSIS